MVSVPYCNLDEIYGDNWKKKSPKNSNTVSGENANKLLQNVRKEKLLENSNIEPSAQNTGNININTNSTCKNCQGTEAGVGYIPNIPTFQNAASCTERNNNFQNQVSQSQFGLPINPLNTHPGNFPPKVVTQTPPYGLGNEYANLPIFNKGNIWPSQRWYPEGPMAYEHNNPYNRMYNPVMYRQFDDGSIGFQKTGDKIRENFGQQTNTNSCDKALKLLQLILFVLVALFMIQIVELLLRIKY